MKTRETTPGKTYSVHTMKGCTIIEPDGWQKTIEAPDGYFDAHFGSVVIEGDDEASIKQLFKLAPQQRLAILGVLGGNVPAWFAPLKAELTALLDGSTFELAWLADENTLVVHTDRVSDELSDAVTALLESVLPQHVEVAHYNHNMEISWRDINKYAECTTVSEMAAVNPDYKNDLTSDGEWVYPLPELKSAASLMQDSTVKKFSTNLPLATSLVYAFSKTPLSGEIVFDLPLANDIHYSFQKTKVTKVTLVAPKNRTTDWAFINCNELKEVHGVFYGDKSKSVSMYGLCHGCKNLRVFDVDFSYVEYSPYAFDMCQLNKESALHFLNKNLSAKKHSLTTHLGIHIDHKTDEELLNAIAAGQAEGWGLTVQWNGTPTAQGAATYGLRNLPIYAKVGEMELPDGTTERVLDWGHYVTDPAGYEEFRSVEEARECYGLPDEPLTETE